MGVAETKKEHQHRKKSDVIANLAAHNPGWRWRT
jgi:hypothetical protein